MTHIPLEHGMILAATLLLLGLLALLVRRNLIFMLIAVEIMLNAAGLAFVVAGAQHGQTEGQVMFLTILTMAAAEVAIGLAIILQIYWRYNNLDSDLETNLKG